MQEIAKLYILKQRHVNLRAMAITVVMPTVLVETQTRLVLMQQQTAGSTLSGLGLLAAVEISIRCAKLVVMRVQISRKRTKMAARMVGISPDSDQLKSLEAAFDAWLARVWQYHMTETTADMYAEYLAIGCSYAIVFFLGDHPHYSLGASFASNVEESSQLSTPLLGASQVVVVAVQVLTEVAIDWLSCCIEILQGNINFALLERDRMFYVVFFVALAILNIMVSCVLYVRDHQ